MRTYGDLTARLNALPAREAGHVATVEHQAGGATDRWYLACGCGYCGPLRPSAESALDDLEGHLRAVRRAAA